MNKDGILMQRLKLLCMREKGRCFPYHGVCVESRTIDEALSKYSLKNVDYNWSSHHCFSNTRLFNHDYELGTQLVHPHDTKRIYM